MHALELFILILELDKPPDYYWANEENSSMHRLSFSLWIYLFVQQSTIKITSARTARGQDKRQHLWTKHSGSSIYH